MERKLPRRRQLLEQILLLGHLNAVRITGGYARVREVHFRFRPLSPINTYRQYFGCRGLFCQREDGVVFSEEDMGRPTVDPDARLYRKATSYIASRFAAVAAPVQARVRAVILELIGKEDCTAARVAARLLLHPRTLHRRLQEEGTSFARVREAVRQDMALVYLQETALPLQRIAENLGYAEHSVLTRSCSRWFCASPSEMRSRGKRVAQAA